MQRAALDHPLLRDGDRFRAWFWLVAKAVWKQTKFDISGKIVTLEPGQLCVSRNQLADEWGWSPSAVERFLTRLQTEHMIGRETGQGRSIITIRNYAKYQDRGSGSGQAPGQGTGQAADKQRTAKEPLNPSTTEPNGSDSPPPPIHDADWPEFPDWLPAEAWNAWLEMRRKKRDWPTAGAVKIAITSLTKWRAKGHDPGEVLNRSTLNNWTGLFEPKDTRNGSGNHASRDHRDDYARSLDRRLGIGGDELPAGQA